MPNQSATLTPIQSDFPEDIVMVSLSRASKVAAILAVSGLGLGCLLYTSPSLGACSAHPGTAAIVGDWSVSEAELDLSSQQLSALMGQQVDAAQFLPDMSSSRAVGQVAEENGVTVSDEEVMQQFQQMGERVVARGGQSTPVEEPTPFLKTIVKDTLALQKLRSMGFSSEKSQELSNQISQIMQSTKVEINPRYGTYNAQSNELTQTVFGDVVRSSSAAQQAGKN